MEKVTKRKTTSQVESNPVDPIMSSSNIFKDIDVMDIPPENQIIWAMVAKTFLLHIFALNGLYHFVTLQVMWKTVIWTLLVYIGAVLGTTAGCHRLWSHKCYKAKLPLRMILMFLQTISFQNGVWEWCRDHRLHHKYTETNADPHNAKRGFFFSHIGWLLCRKHPAVLEKGEEIDLHDLESDSLIMFQEKYYMPLAVTFSLFLPAFVPWYFWDESFPTAWYFSNLRCCFFLHMTFCVNSVAHLWGHKPYDKNINPSENKGVSIFTFGEGWHNYHHVFPWDYKADEYGGYQYNFTTAFIDFFARVGWAYDLKTASDKMISERVKRTGDGSWHLEEEER